MKHWNLRISTVSIYFTIKAIIFLESNIKMAVSDQHWQLSLKTVSERNRQMFNNPFMSDVTFTFKGSSKKLFAHKYVLATSSPVFDKMFNGELRENGPNVQLCDTDEESFALFLRFLYTDDCQLTTDIVDTVGSVLYLAEKYLILTLAKKCSTILEESILVENVFIILEKAILFHKNHLEQKCWQLIDEKTSTAIASDSFVHIEKATLEQLVKRKVLNIEEIALFKAVVNWSQEECSRKNIEVNAKNMREVLGDIIYEIRFASMNSKELFESVDFGLLTSEEKNLLYEKLLGRKRGSEIWNMSPREKPHLRCCRFHTLVVDPNLFEGVTNHAIGVSFNKRAKIHGVCLFGSGNNAYDVTLEVFSQDSAKKEFRFPENVCNDGCGYDVTLPNAVEVTANEVVHVKVTIRGCNMISGFNGKSKVKINDVTITFSDAPAELCRDNCTTVIKGQFIAILYSEC